MDAAVVLLSGGMGSTVAAWRSRGSYTVLPLFLDYGQQCAPTERTAAAEIAEALGVSLQVVELSHPAQILAARDARRGPRSGAPAGVGPVSEVDGLFASLLSVGAEYAAALGAQHLICGAYGPSIDPSADNLSRERRINLRELLHAYGEVLTTAIPAVRTVKLDAPLVDLQPFEVIQLGRRLGAPLNKTRSCSQSGPPCSTCLSCKRRSTAFTRAGVADESFASTQGAGSA